MPVFEYRGSEYEYEVRLSRRAKRMSFVVHWNGRCELILPERKKISKWAISLFIRSHHGWIVRNILKQQKKADKIPLQHQGIPVKVVSEKSLETVQSYIDHYCSIYAFKPKGTKVRSYKTRWGSCSQNNQLRFHYKLSLLSNELIEYVVIHELCHTIHFNHSKQFWSLVEEFCPQYKERRKKLKKYLV